jgi:hypothetical protein
MLKLDILCRRSNYLYGIAGLIFSGAVIIIFLLSIGWHAKALLVLSCLIYGWYSVRHLANLKRIIIYEHDWRIFLNNHKSFAGELQGDSTLTSWVLILRFKILNSKAKQTILVFKDAIDENLYRQLIVAAKNTRANRHGLSG